MKVILLKDVTTLGLKDDICEVSPGYARNFLIPRKLAIATTPPLLEALKAKKKRVEAEKEKELEEMQSLAKRLEGTTFTVKADAGEGGKLFGSVTNQDIAEAIKEESGIEIDKRSILLEEPIKVIGEAEVLIKIFQDIEAKVKVNVLPASKT